MNWIGNGRERVKSMYRKCDRKGRDQMFVPRFVNVYNRMCYFITKISTCKQAIYSTLFLTNFIPRFLLTSAAWYATYLDTLGKLKSAMFRLKQRARHTRSDNEFSKYYIIYKANVL